jgi:thiol-disulfide isomerase/thioredoxin
MTKKCIVTTIIFVLCVSLGFHSSVAQDNGVVHEYSALEYSQWIPFEKNVAMEIFTATWCGWCYKAYDLFDALQEKYGDKIVTNIRYHCQDEISMNTINDRIYYYGVTGFPTVIANGTTKQTGVSEDWFEKFSKAIDNELSEPSDLAIHSNITVRNQMIHFDVFLHSPDRQIEGNFMGLTMVSGLNIKDSVHDYVAESIFPSFDGLHMILQPQKIYHLRFSLPIQENIESKYYSTLCMFQNEATKEVYNSQFCSLYSHVITSTNPLPFETEVARDHQFELQFQDGVIIKTLQSDQFYFLDKDGNVVDAEWSYNATLKTVTITPVLLLEPTMKYVLVVKGGPESFKSVNQQHLYRDFYIPFQTSTEPDLDMYYSTDLLLFDNVSVIDEPYSYVYVEETHGNSVRVSITPDARWIQCSPNEIQHSDFQIHVQLNPLFMVNGKNTGTIEIRSLAGVHTIKVEANRLSDKYPSIRLDAYPLITNLDAIQISGKTDGYKVYGNGKEVNVENSGDFSFTTSLREGLNYILIESKNMRGHTSTYPVTIIRLKS